MAAQVCTFQGVKQFSHRLFRLKVYCKCDTTKATWTDAIIADENNIRIDGKILCVDTEPGATAPTAAYDLELLNTESIDVMGGTLGDRSATANERAYPVTQVAATLFTVKAPVLGPLTVTMANNSVNGADWTMTIYFEKIQDIN